MKMNLQGEIEFQLWNLELRPLLAASITISFILLLLGLFGFGENETSKDWIIFLSLPHFICAMMMLTSCCIAVCSPRILVIKNYNNLCFCILVLFYTNVEWFNVIRALRKNLSNDESVPQIHREVDFSGIWPRITCNDTDPVRTWRQWPFIGTAVGCNNVLISGNIFTIFILIQLLPCIFKMRWRVAVAAACINTVFLVCGVLITGSRSWTLFTAAVFQLTAGFMSAHLCRVHEYLDRKDFLVHRSVLNTTAKNQVLLDAFIPRNVQSQMAVASENEFVHAEIPACTLLFCSVEPEQDIGDDLMSEEYFEFLKNVFYRFDDVVEQNNMFKYQHVGEWYIVACPRAARPFDTDEQQREYPRLWVRNSLLLADALQSIARCSKFRCRISMQLKIGISHGPVAGAVIGMHKAFYCLYGDTVNTAARMCKIARFNSIRCSPAFAYLVLNLAVNSVACESCGVSEVKGKGPMETFSISMQPTSHFQLNCGRLSLESDPTRGVNSRQSSHFDGLMSESASMYSHSESAHLSHSSTQAKLLMNLFFTFRETSVETMYIKDQANLRQGKACRGLAVHLAALLLQFHAIAFPEYAYDYAALGDPALAAGHHEAVLILGCNMAASFAATILIFLHVWMKGHQAAATATGRRVWYSSLILQASWFAVSVAAARSYGTLGWTVMFVTEVVICVKGLLGGTSTFAECAIRILLTTVVGTSCVFLLSEQPTSTTMLQIQPMIPATLMSLALSAISHKSQRTRWRRARLLHFELLRFQHILRDLIPAHIAKRMLEASATPTLAPQGTPTISTLARQEIAESVAGERCRAAVLQLDLCGFTRLSQTLPAVELARLVHRLFSRLDQEVCSLRLFKMDTVGDAYIVAGFLPDPAFQATGANVHCKAYSHQHAVNARVRTVRRTRKVCERLLAFGAAALNELSSVRGETGLEVRGRVGVAIGEVLVGALGRLQPRIHIRGMGMRAADIMEQSGVENAVHASEAFLRVLRGGMGLEGSSGRTGSDGTSGVCGSGCHSDSGKWLAGPFGGTSHAFESADGACREASEEGIEEEDLDCGQKAGGSGACNRMAHLWRDVAMSRTLHCWPRQGSSQRETECPTTFQSTNLTVDSLEPTAVRCSSPCNNVSAALGTQYPLPQLSLITPSPTDAVMAERVANKSEEEWAPVGWSVMEVRWHEEPDPAVPSTPACGHAPEVDMRVESAAVGEAPSTGFHPAEVSKVEMVKSTAARKWCSYVLAIRTA